MGQLLWIMFISAATHTSPLDFCETKVTNTISDTNQLVELGMDFKRLELVNEDADCLDWHDLSTQVEWLSVVLGVYEVPTSPILSSNIISSSLVRPESDVEEKDLSSLGAAVPVQYPITPPMLILATWTELPVGDTPLVKVQDKNPTCPCCGNQIGKMTGLSEHLNRTHGRKKILYQCVHCGRMNVIHHSIACHFPRCKGVVGPTPIQGWAYRECKRVFDSKIGWEQHKRLAHPVVWNTEQTETSCPKANNARGYILSAGQRKR